MLSACRGQFPSGFRLSAPLLLFESALGARQLRVRVRKLAQCLVHSRRIHVRTPGSTRGRSTKRR
ncbi:hypothetical protein ACFPRL_20310 [Pseudoclavibacter helvolus]